MVPLKANQWAEEPWSENLLVVSKPSEKVCEGPRGYKRAGPNQICNRKQKGKQEMKFTQSIITAATLYNLTSAIDLKSTS